MRPSVVGEVQDALGPKLYLINAKSDSLQIILAIILVVMLIALILVLAIGIIYF